MPEAPCEKRGTHAVRSVPTQYRCQGAPVRACEAEGKAGRCLYLPAAVMDHCISLYSLEEWDKLQEGLAAMPMTKARKLQRYLSCQRCRCAGGFPGPHSASPASAGLRLPGEGGAGHRSGQPGGDLESRRLRRGQRQHDARKKWKRNLWSWASDPRPAEGDDMTEHGTSGTYHRPVLLDETIEALAVRPDGVYVDGTAGEADIPMPLLPA